MKAQERDPFICRLYGLLIEGDPTFEECCLELERLSRNHIALHWQLGDLLNYMEGKFAEAYAQALDDTHFSYSTVSRDKWLASRFAHDDRTFSPPLGASHYEAVAAIDSKEIRNALLRECIEQRWTRDELRARARPFKVSPERAYPEDSIGPLDEWIDNAAKMAARSMYQQNPDAIWEGAFEGFELHPLTYGPGGGENPVPICEIPAKSSFTIPPEVTISFEDLSLMGGETVSDALASGPVKLVGKNGVAIGFIVTPAMFAKLKELIVRT